MSSILEKMDNEQIKTVILKVLSWRLGDMPDLAKKLSESYEVKQYDIYKLLELICHALDITINQDPKNEEDIVKNFRMSVNGKIKELLAKALIEIKDKCINFCKEHEPSLSRVVYHDWKVETHIATETLGRIARSVASITLRVQPASDGKLLLPPLQSVSMELAKDMIDALSSGFDRLQKQLSKIIK